MGTNMSDRLIFVSCGQVTPEEKALGAALKGLIDSTRGFRSYFAEYVQSAEALSANIFSALRDCSGFIAVMHDRGRIMLQDGSEWGHRSSVWINQELAIIAYRQFETGRKIPILVFMEPSVRLNMFKQLRWTIGLSIHSAILCDLPQGRQP